MPKTYNSQRTNIAQHIGRILLGLALSFAGTSHLSWSRTEFQAQVPNWIPIDSDWVVILSGIVEITLGLSLLLLSRHQIVTGWIVATFFVLIFPGNIAQWANHTNAFTLNTDLARTIRLFFQPLLVIWALWSTGAWQAWRSRKQIAH
ncbi:hypothetical protein GO730_09430 [Spirosoma sp. HMF3257]|uniref:DoxX family membrane protein n=1 Tax=Spirosoma telluris TaxID=2183553 RepID=A0A327NGK5_9BACT|nr:hypothetical protein [Spirosoma telluris]RAI74432.1 hypothetical protein HMF3257_09335 [Spirosoma telluris]